jgi:hypothetical protein
LNLISICIKSTQADWLAYAVCSYNNFVFSAHAVRSTHDTNFNVKDQNDKAEQRTKIAESERIMKASHFNIGTKDGNMIHPKPV